MKRKVLIIKYFLILTIFCIASSLATSFTNENKLEDDLVLNLTKYTTHFRAKPQSDFSIAFSAKNSTLKFRPAGMGFDNDSWILPVFNLQRTSSNNVRYSKVFGDGVDFEYGVLDDKLKEEIIIRDKESIQLDSLNTDPLIIDFVLEYTNNTVISLDGINEWNGESTITGEPIQFIRRKKSSTLFLVNKYYQILSPYAIDSKGDLLDLTYDLFEIDDETHLSLVVPTKWLNKAEYPVVLDPTVYLDPSDMEKWRNKYNCSSGPEGCYDFVNPSTSKKVLIPDGCINENEYTTKLLFRFEIDGIDDGYTEDLSYAKLILEGTCSNNDELPINVFLKLYQIDDWGGVASCGEEEDGASYVGYVMDEDTCWTDPTYYYSITSKLQSELDDNEEYIAFKLDFDDPYPADDDPSEDIYYEISTGGGTKIEYKFSCYESDDCPSSTHYCKATGECEEKLSDGDQCEDEEIDGNDNIACENGVCALDLDGGDYYCTDSTHCVNGGNQYAGGYRLCNGESWIKTCNGSTWSNQENCTYGCYSGSKGQCDPWWPENITGIEEWFRNDTDVMVYQAFKWDDSRLAAFKALNVDYQWELGRNPPSTDGWDFWRPNTAGIFNWSITYPGCYGIYKSNLPGINKWLQGVRPSEERNVIPSCPQRSVTHPDSLTEWDTALEADEEFEIKSSDPHLLESNKSYYVAVTFKRKAINETINLTSQSEYCKRYSMVCGWPNIIFDTHDMTKLENVLS